MVIRLEHFSFTFTQHLIFQYIYLSFMPLGASIRISRITSSLVCALYRHMSANLPLFCVATGYITAMVFDFMWATTNNALWWPVSTTAHLFKTYTTACHAY